MGDSPQVIAKKPRGRPFQKGNCANPTGRPKKTPELIEVETLAKTYGPEAIERLAHWMRKGDGPVSLKAAETLINRGFGKPIETRNTTVTKRMVVEAPMPAKDADTWASEHGPH